MNTNLITCPCGSNKTYPTCCGRYLDGNEIAATVEALMRSRYTAYALLREDYLLATWYLSTRPAALGLANDVPTKWIGLELKRHEQQDADTPLSNSLRATKWAAHIACMRLAVLCAKRGGGST